MSPEIAVHLAAAVPALVLGGSILALRKGTRLHKALGRVWVVLVALAAMSSFAIFDIRQGAGPSVIHLISVWTLFAVTCAIIYIRRGNRRAHRGFMVGTYIGLISAGVFALAPGRFLNSFLFGG